MLDVQADWRWRTGYQRFTDPITGAVTGIPSNASGGDQIQISLDPWLGPTVVKVKHKGKWTHDLKILRGLGYK